MSSRSILIYSLRAEPDTELVIANFLAGILVGTLLGLALAPILRAWLAWKTAEGWRRDGETSSIDSERTRSTT